MSRVLDVIVIGGGHAGAEAATAAARLGASVLLVTSNLETIGQMSCNPAIGGIAKGTVVREVDALGGVMGRAADRATIHFRMLNRSKGPAVWSPRAQCDRGLYRRAVRNELEMREVQFLQGTVASLITEGQRVTGVRLDGGAELLARSVVLTAGTFLRGRMHVGLDGSVAGGRAGDAAVVDLAVQLEEHGLQVERFKTGTPPRVDGRTVDYALIERQDGDSGGYRFSEYVYYPGAGERPCWITWTGEDLRDIVQTSLAKSALYGGEISGRGPRYCPSIEDKIVRFPDAVRHQIFLEPEGLDTTELYVNGLSTSLPADVQLEFLHSVPGLESVRMTRAGYAIEYDYYPPHQLTPWLEVKELEFLFFAGQVNGTTGYEEAAGQGFVAGVNAALRVRGDDPFRLERDDGYIGVLVDDLVTKGVDEPYRLFTSRAEYRLLMRQDNAIHRLGDIAANLGLLDDAEKAHLDRRREDLERTIRAARTTTIKPRDADPILARDGQTGLKEPQRVSEVVKRPRNSLREFLTAAGVDVSDRDAQLLLTAEIELRYEGYLERERDTVERMKRMSDFALPADLPYADIKSISTEARQKLESVRPATLAQAGRIPGVSPADIQNLVFEILKRDQPAA